MEAHQQLGRGAGGAARLDPARSIGGGEERLRPGRVVAIHERCLGAVDRHRLGVRGEAGHADAQLFRLLDRALEQHAAAAHRGTDGAGHRIGPGIGGDAHRRLDLVEAERDRDGGIGRQLQRVVLGIGDVRLVAGRTALPHLRIGEGDLQRRHLRDHRHELGRRHAARQPLEPARAAR